MSGPTRLTRSISLRVFAGVVLLAVAGGVASHFAFGVDARRSAAFGVAGCVGGLALLFALIAGPLQRIRRNLGALVDGVRGFGDGDVSLRLHVTGDDEISELMSVYNQIGDVLREQRNESLQRELLFETVLQASPLAMILTNQQRRIVFANRAARNLFAPDRSLEGRRIDEVVADVPALRDLGTNASSIFTVEGETYQVSRRTFYLNTREHVLLLIARLTQDLRRQEIEVWKRAIRVVSHELNNSFAPVHSLFHSAQVVRSRGGDDARLEEINSAIAERLQSLQTFLDAYAQFARLPEPRRKRTEWTEIIDAARVLYPFRVDGSPSIACQLDPTQMQQVLINLVKNAHESGSDPAEVVVSVQRSGDECVMRVSDRGRGMTEEVMRQALVPFYSTKPGGSGVGLALSNEIIEAHGGRMHLEHREGGGTVVTCWIPGAS